MKRILGCILLLSFMVACDNDSAAGSSGSANETVDLTIAHVLEQGHPQHVALQEMVDEINNMDESNMNINIIPGGSLGSEEEAIQQISTGSLDMSLIQGIVLFQGIDSRLAVEDVPFLFENRQDAYDAVDGAYGDRVTEILREHNIDVLSFWENGFRHYTNNIRPIENPEDMEGISFRTASSDIRIEMFNQLNSSATTMAFDELFIALQQGTVDGQENPLSIISSSNFNEVQDYLSLSGHIWNTSVLAINPNILEGLSESDQEILQEMASKYKEEARSAIQQEDEEIINELEENMEVNEVDTEAFKRATQDVEEVYIENNGEDGKELLELARNP